MPSSRRFVLGAVALAALLATSTSAGVALAGPKAGLPAKCSLDTPQLTLTPDNMSAKAAANAQCVAAAVTVLKVTFTAEATGSSCVLPTAKVDVDPASVPTWIRVRLDLACKPSTQTGSEGKVGNNISIKMLGPNDVTLADYGLGDGYLDKVASDTHHWHITFTAGMGKPPAGQSAGRTITSPAHDNTEGSTQAQSDHEVY
jgi:hypothetical protein